MSERLSIELAKDFWFGGDLTVFADIGPNATVIALPAQEVIRGMHYLGNLQSCKSYEDAENLFKEFKKDPNAPKLIPGIIDPMEDFEHVVNVFAEYLNLKGVEESEHLNYVDQNLGLRDFMEKTYRGDWLPHEYDYEYRQLAEHIVRTEVPFVWNEALPYLDDNGLFAGCRNAEIWTDNWVPVEITAAIGVPDTGYGIDYYEADYVYTDVDKFVKEFQKHGFEVNLGSKNFSDLFKNYELR
jgi:hypothetical protein